MWMFFLRVLWSGVEGKGVLLGVVSKYFFSINFFFLLGVIEFLKSFGLGVSENVVVVFFWETFFCIRLAIDVF